MRKKILAAALFLLLVPVVLAADEEKRPDCSGQEFRVFDFWVGDWDVEENGKKAGTSSVQRILNDCVIFENWSGLSGYSGKSFNIYNRTLKKWQQFWVDNSGGVLVLNGEYTDGQVRFEGETLQQDGTKIQERLTFYNISKQEVRQVWEQSRDGKTWKVIFDGHYTRKPV